MDPSSKYCSFVFLLGMRDPQIIQLVLLTLGGLVGFFAGYGVRAALSHHHRVIAKRNRAAGYF
jgi:hypothetical protein